MVKKFFFFAYNMHVGEKTGSKEVFMEEKKSSGCSFWLFFGLAPLLLCPAFLKCVLYGIGYAVLAVLTVVMLYVVFIRPIVVATKGGKK